MAVLPRRPRRRSVAGSLLVAALLIVETAHAAESLWTLAVVGGREARIRSAGMTADGDVLVDAATTAAFLGLADDTRPSSEEPASDTGDRGVNASYDSLGSLARRARMQLVLSAAERRAYLFPIVEPVQQAGSVVWAPVRVEKTAAELEEMRRRQDVPLEVASDGIDRSILPPEHSTLMFHAGVGYVAGADAATMLDLFGTSGGYRISGNAFLTYGSQRLRYVSGRTTLESPGLRWKLELGDLFGELQGLTRGTRLTILPEGRWSPSLAVYVPPDARARDAVLAYRDRLTWTSHVETTTEFTSEGSVFVRASAVAARAQADIFYRRDRTRGVEDRGVSGSLNVWRGVSVFAAGRVSDGRSADRWLRGGIGVPIGRGAQLMLEETRSQTDMAETRTDAVSLHLPFGRLQVHQRFQAADTAFLSSLALDANYRQAQTTVSYALSRRVHLSYQSGAQWLQGGDVRQFREAQANLTLASRTSLRLTANVPAVLDARQLTVRVNHELSRAWSLNGEYGRVSTYQPVSREDADARRLAVLVTRRFAIRTPAGGATVEGQVVDQGDRPVRGALVRVGPYAAMTDASGIYRIHHVPRGSYPVRLDPDHVPAGYAAPPAAAATVSVAATHVRMPRLEATALQRVTGRVYLDRNASGGFDGGEGLDGIVLLMGDRATRSEAGGLFSFFNVAPGQHRIELDESRLRGTLEPASPSAVSVNVWDAAHVDVAFVLRPRSVPIRLQPWPGQ